MGRPPLALRALALGGVAFLAGVVALAVHSGTRKEPAALPPAVHWYEVKATPYGPTPGHRVTACGQRLDAQTLGVAHPVMPCGIKIYIQFENHRVLTQVIDRGPNLPGREFNVTKALADQIGLHGTRTIRWSLVQARVPPR
ncbi:MAG: rare lipoprotein [Gaiellaceae bacterium]|jgi:3D (Asp-Asp-Asp) domain-containing protein|nr:rare lipoprotein [Gaiellaceae bacterium]